MERILLAPAALHRQAEPYKRILGVLLRPTCVSIAVSNHYLSLAEPAGAFLLRDGRVPERTLAKLLKPYCAELTGVVLGSESHASYRDLTAAAPAAATLRQVHAVLQSAAPGLSYTWWDRWTPDTPASCRISPGPPPLNGPGADGQPRASSELGAGAETHVAGGLMAVGGEAAQQQQQRLTGPGAPSRPAGPGTASGGGVPCSMGTLFLQHYLDNLGSLNTFG